MNNLGYKEVTPKNINEAISILKDEINLYEKMTYINYNDDSHLKIKKEELKSLEAFKLGNKVSLLGQNFLILHNKKIFLMLLEGDVFNKPSKTVDLKEVKSPLIKTEKWRPKKGAKY